MKKLVSSALLFSASAFGAGFPSLDKVHGNYVEARTADVYTGPCFANSEVGLTGELAVMGWKITQGSWSGVKLDGLSIVAVVKAKSTLGDIHTASNPAKSILIVDQSATEEQRTALQAYAKHMGGELFNDVVRVEYQPIFCASPGDSRNGRKRQRFDPRAASTALLTAIRYSHVANLAPCRKLGRPR